MFIPLLHPLDLDMLARILQDCPPVAVDWLQEEHDKQRVPTNERVLDMLLLFARDRITCPDRLVPDWSNVRVNPLRPIGTEARKDPDRLLDAVFPHDTVLVPWLKTIPPKTLARIAFPGKNSRRAAEVVVPWISGLEVVVPKALPGHYALSVPPHGIIGSLGFPTRREAEMALKKKVLEAFKDLKRVHECRFSPEQIGEADNALWKQEDRLRKAGFVLTAEAKPRLRGFISSKHDKENGHLILKQELIPKHFLPGVHSIGEGLNPRTSTPWPGLGTDLANQYQDEAEMRAMLDDPGCDEFSSQVIQDTLRTASERIRLARDSGVETDLTTLQLTIHLLQHRRGQGP